MKQEYNPPAACNAQGLTEAGFQVLPNAAVPSAGGGVGVSRNIPSPHARSCSHLACCRQVPACRMPPAWGAHSLAHAQHGAPTQQCALAIQNMLGARTAAQQQQVLRRAVDSNGVAARMQKERATQQEIRQPYSGPQPSHASCISACSVTSSAPSCHASGFKPSASCAREGVGGVVG